MKILQLFFYVIIFYILLEYFNGISIALAENILGVVQCLMAHILGNSSILLYASPDFNEYNETNNYNYINYIYSIRGAIKVKDGRITGR